MNLATYLARARENTGLTLRQIEDASGLSHAYVWRLENGERESPSQEKLDLLSAALRLSDGQRTALMILALQDAPDVLIQAIELGEDQDLEHWTALASASARGKRPETVEEWLELHRKFLEMFA